MQAAQHNQFRRRMRRRWPFESYSWAMALVSVLVIVLTPWSLVIWLQPEGTSSTAGVALRWSWAIIAFFKAFLGAVMLLFQNLASPTDRRTGRTRLLTQGSWFPLGLSSCVALVSGRIELAVWFIYLFAAFSHIVSALYLKSSAGLVTAALCGVVVAAFHLRVAWLVWLAATAIYLTETAKWFTKWSPLWRRRLRDALAGKPSRLYYGSKALASGPIASMFGNSKLLKSLFEAEMWDEALVELEKVEWTSKMERRYAVSNAAIFVQMGKYEEVLDLVSKDSRDDLAAWTAIAMVHLGQHEAALRSAQTAVANRKDYAEFAMGIVLEQTGDLEGALEWTERAATQMQRRGSMMRRVAQLLMKLGDFEEARVAWEQSVRLLPFVCAADLDQLAECYAKLDKVDRADEARALSLEYSES